MESFRNDIELLDALHKKDAKAFSHFHDQTVIGLCYFLENRIGDRPAAEDIATECFIKAFQRITDFKTISKLKSFLYTAANNAAIDHINAKKRHNASHNEIEYLSRSEEEDVEVQFIRSEVLESIYKQIDNLPVQSREVIRLSVLEGKSIRRDC
jgi:RNA polymerase sigma-70 factor (ECF subfamily)